jgi:hypothetical protein
VLPAIAGINRFGRPDDYVAGKKIIEAMTPAGVQAEVRRCIRTR